MRASDDQLQAGSGSLTVTCYGLTAVTATGCMMLQLLLHACEADTMWHATVVLYCKLVQLQQNDLSWYSVRRWAASCRAAGKRIELHVGVVHRQALLGVPKTTKQITEKV